MVQAIPMSALYSNDAPGDKVSNLTAPFHIEKFKFASTWKIPRALLNDNSDNKIERIHYSWIITGWLESKIAGGPYPLEEHINWNPREEPVTESILDLYWVKFRNGQLFSTAQNFAFYPQGSAIVRSIAIEVGVDTSQGWGPRITESTTIDPPKEPKISSIVQDSDTGRVTAIIDRDSDGFVSLHNPLTDTHWTKVIYDSRTKKTSKKTGTFSQESKTLTYDVNDRQQLLYPKYVEFRVVTYSRGIGGNSSTKRKSLYIGQPAKPAIITKKIVCPAYGKTGNVVVPIKLNAKKTHPVTGVRLQYISNVTYTKASQIPSNAGWQDCGVADNKNCNALAVDAGSITSSELGKRTWIRIKTWNQTENILPNYSSPVQLTKLYKAPPTATDDKCGIVSLTPGSDGTSVTVVIGYTENNTNTGTEVTWAEKSNSWRSNEQPQAYTFTWKDSTKKSNKWGKTTTIVIRGLNEGVKYYFRARRYLESDTGTTFTPYSAKMSVVPALAPSNVVLSAPTIVKIGSGCTVGWTYDGGTQKSWRILSNGKVVVSGSNKKDRASITAAQLKNHAINGVVKIAVEVTTNGGSKTSSENTITLATPPSVSISILNGVCTKQPLVINTICSTKVASLTVVIRANGCGAGGPGTREQIRNDVIWSGSVTPTWVAQRKNILVVNYLSKIAIPTGLDLRDKARYTVTVNAIDTATNLKSSNATATFQVLWARQAPKPLVTITSYDTFNSETGRTLSCKINVQNASGSIATDSYDIWRSTPDGLYLVYNGAARGNIITDKYAPYGRDGTSLKYRVVSRTVDGDTEWDDFPYTLVARELRIDFGRDYVELPYNLSVTDSWTKDFETRRKMDGSIDGYWNDGTERKGKLSSQIIKITDADTASKIRALAKYTGPCLVRLPDGCCYTANIDVEDLTWAFKDLLMAVSISATEINPGSFYSGIPETV